MAATSGQRGRAELGRPARPAVVLYPAQWWRVEPSEEGYDRLFRLAHQHLAGAHPDSPDLTADQAALIASLRCWVDQRANHGAGYVTAWQHACRLLPAWVPVGY